MNVAGTVGPLLTAFIITQSGWRTSLFLPGLYSLNILGITCDFTSFSAVFQSYQDNGKVIMKGCVQLNPVYSGKEFCIQRESNPGLLDQWVSA